MDGGESEGAFREGWLAVSKAGHDKGQIYVITEVRSDGIYVADGRLRPVENPKKKNPKHLQPIKRDAMGMLPQERQDAARKLRNEDIKYILRLVNKSC